VVFSLVLTNGLAAAVSNAVVRDVVSPWLACLPGTVSAPGAYEASTRTVTWPLGTFGAGSNRVLVFSAAVSNAATYFTPITNVATVVSDQTGTNASDAVVLRVPLPFLPDRRFGGGGGNLGSYSNRSALGIACERMPVNLTAGSFANPDGIDFGDPDMKVLAAQASGVRKFGVIAYNGYGTCTTSLGDPFGRAPNRARRAPWSARPGSRFGGRSLLRRHAPASRGAGKRRRAAALQSG
jgi:hypothetical protein